MKKVLSLLAVAAAALSLAACDSKEEPTKNPSTEPTVEESEKTETSTPDKTEEEDEDEVFYTTKLLLPNGEVYKATRVQIQYCDLDTGLCLKPVKIDEEGIATFGEANSIDFEKDYIVHVMPTETEFLAKYTYNINAYKGNMNNKDLAIQLYDKKSLGTEAGSKADPMKVTELGGYTLKFDSKKFVEFSFVAPKTGKITLESFAAQISNPNIVDASLFFTGENGTATPVEVKKGGVGNNFKYEFDAEEGKTYRFAVGCTKATSFPASFDFVIA